MLKNSNVFKKDCLYFRVVKWVQLYNLITPPPFFFSTNGTVINMSKLVKKQTHMLQNGDVIYFVYRKNEPEQSEFCMFLTMRVMSECLSEFRRSNVHPLLFLCRYRLCLPRSQNRASYYTTYSW